jgi:hypothetical protein
MIDAAAARHHAQGYVDALLAGREVATLGLSCKSCQRKIRRLHVVPDPRAIAKSLSIHDMAHCCSVVCADRTAARIAQREARAAKRDPRDRRQALVAALARGLAVDDDGDEREAEAAE